MDEKKMKYRVTIEMRLEDSEESSEIYSQLFDDLNIAEVVKRLNGGF